MTKDRAVSVAASVADRVAASVADRVVDDMVGERGQREHDGEQR
jgi:hypothetical protein